MKSNPETRIFIELCSKLLLISGKISVEKSTETRTFPGGRRGIDDRLNDQFRTQNRGRPER